MTERELPKIEINRAQEQETTPHKLEVSLESKEDLKKLENWLKIHINEEESEQLIHVLRSMAEDDYVNQCKEATKSFGKELARNFGGEESFFDITGSVEFIDARSDSPLNQIGYSGDYHSVAVLEFSPENRQPFSLIFDLTYSTVSSDSDGILTLHSPGNSDQAMNTLNNHYGGYWKKELIFNKEKGTFVYQNGNQ